MYLHKYTYILHIHRYIHISRHMYECLSNVKKSKVKKHSGKMQTYGSLETEPCFHLVLCCVGKTISFLQIQVVKKRTPSS